MKQTLKTVSYIFLACIGLGMTATMWIDIKSPRREELTMSGSLVLLDDRHTYDLSDSFIQELYNSTEFPTWRLFDRYGQPKWGFVLLNDTNKVSYITNTLKYKLVPIEEVLSLEYEYTMLPIYDPKHGYFNTLTQRTAHYKPRTKFFVVVDLH